MTGVVVMRTRDQNWTRVTIAATSVHWSTGANPNPLRDDAQKSMMVEYEGRVTHMVALVVFIGPN